jgi:predicted DNA-binding transcriptional regulator YafY
MFTTLEAQALVACVRIAQSRLDRSLAIAAEDALGKIVGVLTPAARAAAETLPLYAAPWASNLGAAERLGLLREAATARRRIRFDYADAQGAATTRTARPLGCYHWESVWTLAAWCEQRDAFRSFRIDRMRTLDVLDEVFRDEPGRTLPDFLRHVKRQGKLPTRDVQL